MPIYMNPLESHEDIEDYEKWLSIKSFHYLKCLLGNFIRDQQKEKPVYVNLSLRIQLVNKEMEKRKK